MTDSSVLSLEMSAIVIGDGIQTDFVVAFAAFVGETLGLLNGFASAAGLKIS